jgi:ABC-type dipeptide/oligopeptide/nickel transport system permease component
MFLATLIAVVVAVMSVRRPGGLFDQGARTVIFVFLAMPGFWLGIELIIIFSRKLGWFPPAGRGEGSFFLNLPDHLSHLFLPAITLGVGTAASLCRVLRASLLEILHSDFIRTARAKGLSGRIVLMRHALRNALIPFVTLSGISIAALLEGSIIIESIFAWPGIGQWMVEAIKGRDAPVVMAGVLLTAVVYAGVNLIVDFLYTVIDPRVRLDGGSSAK